MPPTFYYRRVMKTVDEIKAEIKRLRFDEEASYGASHPPTDKMPPGRMCLVSQVKALRWVLKKSKTPL